MCLLPGSFNFNRLRLICALNTQRHHYMKCDRIIHLRFKIYTRSRASSPFFNHFLLVRERQHRHENEQRSQQRRLGENRLMAWRRSKAIAITGWPVTIRVSLNHLAGFARHHHRRRRCLILRIRKIARLIRSVGGEEMSKRHHERW